MKRKIKNVGKKNTIKNVFLTLCVVLTAVLFIPGVHTQAASRKSQAMKAYASFLSKHPSKYKKAGNAFYNAAFSMEDKSYIDEFFLYDMDKNGVPELFTCTYVNFRWEIIRVYTWKNHKVVLCNFSDGTEAVFNNCHTANGSYNFNICKKNHIHNVFTGGMENSTKIYKGKKGKLIEILTFREMHMLDKTDATKNGKRITTAKYYSYTKGCTYKNLTWYKNNKKDRAKLKNGKSKINK